MRTLVLASPLVVTALVLVLWLRLDAPVIALAVAAQGAALCWLAWRALAAARRDRDDRGRADHNTRAITDSAPDAVLIHRDGLLLYLNPSARRMLRVAGTPTTLAELVVDPSLLPTALDGQVATIERELALVSGSSVTVEMSSGLITFEGGAAALSILRDHSDRRRLRERLVTTDRLVSLGTLAAGVAHEINNPLAVVLWNLELVRDELAAAGSAEARRMIAEAMDAAERVRGIVADMRTLSRAPGTRSGPVDPVRVIDRALQIAAGTLKHRARIVREYGPVPTALADEARLVQVVINLLTNAADAIPAERAGQGTITVGTHVGDDGDVVAWVRDDGVGIPPEVQARIFDPFFTTKEVGVGTGLGLSISHTLVTSMQGRLLVDSAIGRGTTVSIVLRAADGAAPQRRNSEPPRMAPPRTRARILIVDDEAAIGAVATRLLGRAHVAEAVTSGRAALARLEAGERFDLILCDLLMPEMTGLDLHARLRADHAEHASRVVFMTGGVGQDARDAAARLPAVVLDKPLNARALGAFVDEFLAGRASAGRAA